MKKGKRVAPGSRTLPFIKKRASAANHGKKKKVSGKLKPFLRKYRLYIVLGAILLATLLITLLIYNLLKPPPIDNPIPPPPVSGLMPNEGSDAPSTHPSGYPDNSGGPGEAPVYQNNESIRTILGVASFDGTNTDTIMVGVLDHDNNTLKVLSVPRDTAIVLGGRLDKINAVHSRTKESDKKMENLLTEVARLIGFYPNFDVFVRSNAFKRMVNTVGGVDFNVPVDMYKEGENINLSKGQQRLNGDKALMLLRYRGYSGSGSIPGHDYGRMYMQQQFLTAAAKQILTLKNIDKIPKFIDIFKENVTTSLELSDMTYFANEVMQCVDADSIEFYTLPTKDYNTYHDDGRLAGSYQAIIVDEAVAMLNEHFNPFTTDITADTLQLSYYFPTRNDALVKP